jgi:hypothetical protein
MCDATIFVQSVRSNFNGIQITPHGDCCSALSATCARYEAAIATHSFSTNMCVASGLQNRFAGGLSNVSRMVLAALQRQTGQHQIPMQQRLSSHDFLRFPKNYANFVRVHVGVFADGIAKLTPRMMELDIIQQQFGIGALQVTVDHLLVPRPACGHHWAQENKS